MSLRITKILYVIFGSFLVMWVILSIKLDKRLDKAEDWVAGQYGKYCYDQASVPKTITKPVYFESLDDCLKFINQ
jgi:hypothetical protein